MHTITKEVTRTVTTEVKDTLVVVTLTLSEARELHKLLGDSSRSERNQIFGGAQNYPSKYPGANDIFGYLWESLDVAKL